MPRPTRTTGPVVPSRPSLYLWITWSTSKKPLLGDVSLANIWVSEALHFKGVREISPNYPNMELSGTKNDENLHQEIEDYVRKNDQRSRC